MSLGVLFLNWHLLPEFQALTASLPSGPLQGVVVVEIGSNISGPATTALLAAQGALVIKVERPGGDPSRQYLSSSEFGTLNVGKKSYIAESPGDYAELLRLADVIVDNRSQGAKDRDSVLQSVLLSTDKVRPLIFCSITGYPGVEKDRVALDQSVQAETGMAAANADIQGNPQRVGFVALDLTTPLRAAFDIAATLFSIQKGIPVPEPERLVRIEVSMAQVASYLLFGHYHQALEGRLSSKTKNKRAWVAPFSFYSAKDGLLAIGITQDDQFKRFSEFVLERPELGLLYPKNQKRITEIESLEKSLNEILITRDRREWVERCRIHRIPCSSVNSLPEAVKQPFVQEFMVQTPQGTRILDTRSFSSLFPKDALPHFPALGEGHQEVQACLRAIQGTSSVTVK